MSVRPRGVDLRVDQCSDDVFAEVMVSRLTSKGFCTIDLGLPASLSEQVLTEVSDLKASGQLYQPATAVAEGLLGTEGSARIAELDRLSSELSEAPGGSDGLRQINSMITSIGVSLGPHTDRLGFDLTHRSHALLHETGIPDAGPPLTEKDVTRWLEKFLRHTLMVVVFLGPAEGVLTLKVFEEEEAEAYEVPTAAGTMVVLRPDILSHQHVSLGRAMAVSSFFIHVHAFQKRHPTGGWNMCPAARELDRWAMDKVRALKGRVQDELDWDPAVPQEFRRAMNLSYFKGNMVAVRGVACKFPGTWLADTHFRSFTAGVDYVTHIPYARWDQTQYYDENPECWRWGKTNSKHGAFMEGVELFDAKLFSLSLAESKSMDPHQRLILEVGYDALHRMGMRKNTLMNAAGSVYVGHAFGDWGFVEKSADVGLGPTGGAGCIAANRLSFVLGIKGPSMALDTDQSSSMTAVFMTAESIQKKGHGVIADFGAAIGAQIMLTPTWWTQHTAMSWLSSRGRCLTYDAAASGFVRGEGVGSAAMRPLSEVVDGQCVRDEKLPLVGVLAGTSLNTNGKGSSLAAPNGMAEQEVIAEAVRNASIASQDVDAVEAHGAGHPLSDVIEVGSLLRAHRYEDNVPLAITSVKTVVGNMMESGGIASLMKNLLGAQWGFMACLLHLRELNPHMDDLADNNPAAVLSEHLAYTRRSAFAGAMSRGFGGTNVYGISWGTLDEEKVPLAAGSAAGQQQIHFWPGGGGFLDAKDRPEKGYYIVGSWVEWSNPQRMEEEEAGVYGYTVMLGENAWEQFQIVLDGDLQRVLHPGGAKMGKETAVYGPDEGIAGASTWIIDGRCNWVEASDLLVEGAAPTSDGPGHGSGDAGYELAPVDTLDAGKPGDKYRVRLCIAGKWRLVSWDKEGEATAEDKGVCPVECIGKYYVIGSWSGWEFEELTQDANEIGLHYTEVVLRWGTGEFQIVRNKDPCQVLYPTMVKATEDTEVLGPDEGGDGLHWFIKGRPGDVFRIELQRSVADGNDVKKVSWQHVRRE
uniref:Type I polyketide synthase n=1 Tax=Gambierdiscus excentricus TaxID=986170 RepID=A0A1S6K7U3_9DINO|nr:type I polyketide synthase [Gambierdiscus excentricus]